MAYFIFDPQTRAFRAIHPESTRGERKTDRFRQPADLWIGHNLDSSNVPPTLEYHHYFEADGLSQYDLCILVANDGALWLSTTRGTRDFDTRAQTY